MPGGVSLTLSGLNFLSLDRSATVQLGQNPCITTSWSSPTSLSCKAAALSGDVEPLVDYLSTEFEEEDDDHGFPRGSSFYREGQALAQGLAAPAQRPERCGAALLGEGEPE